jgi:hypothetical protein
VVVAESMACCLLWQISDFKPQQQVRDKKKSTFQRTFDNTSDK